MFSFYPPGYWGLGPGHCKCHSLLLFDSKGATPLPTAVLLLLLLAQERSERQLCQLNNSVSSTLWHRCCSKSRAVRQLPDSIIHQWPTRYKEFTAKDL